MLQIHIGLLKFIDYVIPWSLSDCCQSSLSMIRDRPALPHTLSQVLPFIFPSWDTKHYAWNPYRVLKTYSITWSLDHWVSQAGLVCPWYEIDPFSPKSPLKSSHPLFFLKIHSKSFLIYLLFKDLNCISLSLTLFSYSMFLLFIILQNSQNFLYF